MKSLKAKPDWHEGEIFSFAIFPLPLVEEGNTLLE
jgi:hypothetical protein